MVFPQKAVFSKQDQQYGMKVVFHKKGLMRHEIAFTQIMIQFKFMKAILGFQTCELNMNSINLSYKHMNQIQIPFVSAHMNQEKQILIQFILANSWVSKCGLKGMINQISRCRNRQYQASHYCQCLKQIKTSIIRYL